MSLINLTVFGENILINGQYAQASSTKTTDFIKLRSPKDAKELQLFNRELNTILENKLKNPEFKECCEKSAYDDEKQAC
ncbi:MAG: hypothetical protein ABH836_07655 [Candidatus Omnitrophota bacterium]